MRTPLTRTLITRPTTTGTRDIRADHGLVRAMLGDHYQRPDDCRELWATPAPGRLLIQHPTPLDPRWLPPGWRIAGTHPVQDHHPAGAHLRWAIVANPTTDRRQWVDGDRKPNHRDGLKDPDAIRAWATVRLACLAITSYRQHRRDAATATKPDRTITLRRAHLTGTGIVGDPDRLTHLIRHGLGHGKAYGCGLLVCEPTG